MQRRSFLRNAACVGACASLFSPLRDAFAGESAAPGQIVMKFEKLAATDGSAASPVLQVRAAPQQFAGSDDALRVRAWFAADRGATAFDLASFGRHGASQRLRFSTDARRLIGFELGQGQIDDPLSVRAHDAHTRFQRRGQRQPRVVQYRCMECKNTLGLSPHARPRTIEFSRGTREPCPVGLWQGARTVEWRKPADKDGTGMEPSRQQQVIGLDVNKAWLDGFFPAFMLNSRTAGKTWGIPFQRSTVVMYWNKELFKQAGLDANKPPATWAELKDMATKLTKKDAAGKVTQYGVQIPSSGFPYWLFQTLTTTNGAILANDSGTAVKFDEPKVVEALQFWVDLGKAGIHPPGVVEWGTTPKDFFEKKAAIIYTTTGNLTNIRNNAKFDFGVAMIPANQRKGSPTGGGNFYIFKKSSPAQQEAAFKFIKWITQPERAAQWSIDTGYVAVSPAAYDTPALKKYTADFPPALVARDQLPFAVAEFSTHDNQRVTKALNDGLQAALTGTKSAEQAMKDQVAATGAQSGQAACVPKTCAQQGFSCGPAGDGCGGTLNCGTCTGLETCGGGVVANQCGCTAAGNTCDPANISAQVCKPGSGCVQCLIDTDCAAGFGCADPGTGLGVQPEIVQRLAGVQVGLAAGDDAEPGVRRIDDRAVQPVGAHVGQRGVPLEVEQTRLLLQR